MFVQPLFSKKEADPIRKRLQQKNLSVWKGFYLIIRNYNRHHAWLLLHREGNHFRLERRSRG